MGHESLEYNKGLVFNKIHIAVVFYEGTLGSVWFLEPCSDSCIATSLLSVYRERERENIHVCVSEAQTQNAFIK